jgi:hypothetical protein
VPWAKFIDAFRSSATPLPQPWGELFGPLRTGAVDDLVIVGQIGQSLDGRIATESGHSKYINGPAGLDHLHRLRSLVDAVVIGVGTALADDPKKPLTPEERAAKEAALNLNEEGVKLVEKGDLEGKGHLDRSFKRPGVNS